MIPLVLMLLVVAALVAAVLVARDIWAHQYRPGIDRTLRRADDRFARRNPAHLEDPA